jgi:hypothetical protein
MKLKIDATDTRPELAGMTECVSVVAHARAGADLQALFAQLLPPEDAAKLFWPHEAAAGWVEGPEYREYESAGGAALAPEIFDAPSGYEEPAHVIVWLYGIAKGTPAADAMRYTPER